MAAMKRTAQTARKTKTGKTKKKAKSTARKKAARTRTLTFKCRSGACSATPNELHVAKGDTVVMKAVGTDVTVRFNKSPFKKKVFNIPAGKQESAVVDKGPGKFKYRLKCASCPTPALPPQIIID